MYVWMSRFHFYKPNFGLNMKFIIYFHSQEGNKIKSDESIYVYGYFYKK